MSYTFDEFLPALDANWYEDDTLLQRLLARHGVRDGTPELPDWGAHCAGELRELAEQSARLENRPALRPFDAHNRRRDEIVLPASTQSALRIVEGRHRLGALRGDPFSFAAQVYLCLQNGEAGVGCSLACTDGMVRALELLGDQPIHSAVVREVRDSSFERYTHGAQFVTEIQGGSDAGANRLEARLDGERWTLHGQKWFCSNINADYFLVTGRPTGAPPGGDGVALFLVPAWQDSDRATRNGYTIDRLKDKLGTCELATAEVSFNGAEAHPLGPLDRGLANVVAIVLVTSRMACVGVAASFLRRAERVAGSYAGFRKAFGRRVIDFPLVAATVQELAVARERTLAALLELVRMWRAAEESANESSTEALDFRYILGLCKSVLTRLATDRLHDAIMVLGGNGIEERFSPLPRLWRDSIVMETWEGPHNVLFTQVLRDMRRFRVDPAAFVARLCGEPRPDLSRELGAVLSASTDEATIAMANFAPKLVHAFGERALQE
jgi:alkylation response protein AidB-like acyl-CoA dehydrogenase